MDRTMLPRWAEEFTFKCGRPMARPRRRWFRQVLEDNKKTGRIWQEIIDTYKTESRPEEMKEQEK
jgi:hypothetical protein